MAGKKKTYSFGAMLSRMKYIDRWALMRNSTKENISEHSLEVAMVAHLLAVIGRVRFGKDLDAHKAALIGVYHDSTEIITGDMPTPIKYYGADIKQAYKRIEKEAAEKLLSNLTPEMRTGIAAAAMDNDEAVTCLVKAADKLDAYIKCLEEINAGNRDFETAAKQTRAALDKMDMPEAKYFIENYMAAFSMTVDEL